MEKEGLDAAAIRPVMIHAQLLGLDQLPELKRLGVLPSFFVAHVYHWGDVHVKNLGPERAAHISPAGSAARLGIPFTFHQDAPVIRPDMLETVWCAVEPTPPTSISRRIKRAPWPPASGRIWWFWTGIPPGQRGSRCGPSGCWRPGRTVCGYLNIETE